VWPITTIRVFCWISRTSASQVDVPILGEKRGHFGAHLDCLYERPREGGEHEGGLDHACQFRSRAQTLSRLSGWRCCPSVCCMGTLHECVITGEGWGRRN
jgi:hypothetical protein